MILILCFIDFFQLMHGTSQSNDQHFLGALVSDIYYLGILNIE